MKQHKETDQIIRKKMEQYSVETPMHLFDGIMDAIDVEAAPKQKPWGKGWLFSLLALMLVGGGLWYAFYGNAPTGNEKLSVNLDENNQNIVADKTTIDGTETNDESIISSEKNTAEIQTSNTETQFSNIISKTSKNQNTIVENAATQNSANNSTTTFSNSNQNQATENNNVFTNHTFSKTIQNRQSENGILKNIPTPVYDSKKDQLMEKGGNIKSATTFPQNESTNFDLNNNASTRSNTTAATFIKNATATNKNNKVITNRSTKEAVLFLPDLRSKHQLSRKQTPYDIKVDPLCGLKPDGSKIRFTTSIDAFFSPDYAVQMLEYKSEDFRHHAEMRTDSESPYYSFNTGIRVNFLTEFDWAFRTGIVYTQINDILKTTHKEYVIGIDPVSGDTLSFTEGTRDVNIRNRYKMVDIPILIGYEVQMKRFTLNVNGGVYVNLSSKQSGAFFSPLEDKVVYFTEGHPENYEHDVFKNRVGMSAFLGLGFNFDLGKRFKNTQLIIEPHTRFYPKSFTVKNYILNQKYLSTGVMIGLRKDL